MYLWMISDQHTVTPDKHKNFSHSGKMGFFHRIITGSLPFSQPQDTHPFGAGTPRVDTQTQIERARAPLPLAPVTHRNLQHKHVLKVWPKFNSYLDHPKVPAVRFVITKLHKRARRECRLIDLWYKSTGKSKKFSPSFENVVNQNRSPLFGCLYRHRC